MPSDPPMLMGTSGATGGCADPPCDAYPFKGFNDPTQKYQTVTIYDWDCCLYGPYPLTGDSYGGESAPTSWDSTDGCCTTFPDGGKFWNDSTGIPDLCQTIRDANPTYTVDDPVGYCDCWNPHGNVDGHITYKAINNCYAVVTDGAGNPLISQPIGTIVSIGSIQTALDDHGTVDSDTKANSGIINDWCGNGDGSKIFFILSDPQ